MYVCGGGEEKRKAGGTCVVGKKKKGKKKKKKEMGSGVYVFGGIKGRVEKKEEKKNLKRKKLNWFYLYVHFVWYKM
jgi:hypothetical protein